MRTGVKNNPTETGTKPIRSWPPGSIRPAAPDGRGVGFYNPRG